MGHTTGFLFSLIHELEKQLFSTFKVPPHQYPILLKFSITMMIRLNEKKTLFLLSYKLHKHTHRKAKKLNFANINIKLADIMILHQHIKNYDYIMFGC